jgi:DNA ligase D-like protein (predicted 3'-phosphoesterase)
MTGDKRRAVRVRLHPRSDARAFAERVRELALTAGVRGWVRGDAAPGEPVAMHAEGTPAAVDGLLDALGPAVEEAAVASVKVEGHEQFAVRGVPAGRFVVAEHQARAHHYDLRLEVAGTMRSWAVPKGPSLDPAVKRFAVQVDDHAVSRPDVEGATGGGGKIVWDQGVYEQGGRVPWPEAIERGHAVFVLHGDKLAGGWALQRTRSADPPQWLLVKRRDEAARPGSDITAQRPESVLSGRTLDELLGRGAST